MGNTGGQRHKPAKKLGRPVDRTADAAESVRAKSCWSALFCQSFADSYNSSDIASMPASRQAARRAKPPIARGLKPANRREAEQCPQSIKHQVNVFKNIKISAPGRYDTRVGAQSLRNEMLGEESTQFEP